jgi:hypothetical protein
MTSTSLDKGRIKCEYDLVSDNTIIFVYEDSESANSKNHFFFLVSVVPGKSEEERKNGR